MEPGNIMTPPTHQSLRERRRAPRFLSHKSSVLIQNNERIYTTIVNLSASGVGFLSARPIEVGSAVELLFETEIEDGTLYPFHLEIEVMRCTPHEDECEIGAKLKHVTFEYRSMLKKIANLHTTLGQVLSHSTESHSN
jgi:hypothetical protein